MASIGGRQDSPMIDEVLDGGAHMDVTDSEDSALASNANTTNLLNELAANDRTVHSDFQNKFDLDLFDDKDLQ